jgi:hypothetical protein
VKGRAGLAPVLGRQRPRARNSQDPSAGAFLSTLESQPSVQYSSTRGTLRAVHHEAPARSCMYFIMETKIATKVR